MKILLAHNSYLGQFEYFGPWLESQGHEIMPLYRSNNVNQDARESTVFFDANTLRAQGQSEILKVVENAWVTGIGAAAAAVGLRDKGYNPDVIISHCGWGTGLFLKNVWPDAVYIAYHEWFYKKSPMNSKDYITRAQLSGEASLNNIASDAARNAPILAEFVNADACWSPNKFQASQFPPLFQKNITVTHDGVDTKLNAPDPEACVDLDRLSLPKGTEIITYVGRGFEPTRGFTDFMRALKKVQNKRPDTHAIIIGENRVSYGSPLPYGQSWLHRMLDELDMDLSRIHFPGKVSYSNFRRILQSSSVHVYLSVPFVLSWSFAEAMSIGCLMVASDQPAIREVITHEKHGLLVKPGDNDALAEAINYGLEHQKDCQYLRDNARQLIVDKYDRDNIYPERLAMMEKLVEKKYRRGMPFRSFVGDNKINN